MDSRLAMVFEIFSGIDAASDSGTLDAVSDWGIATPIASTLDAAAGDRSPSFLPRISPAAGGHSPSHVSEF